MVKSSLAVISTERYNTLRSMLKKTFSVPVNRRTAEQKRARVAYTRCRCRLGLTTNDELTLDGKLVVTEETVGDIIQKEFSKNLGMGV